MATNETPTINQLMDLFLLSRNRGERVKLSMESKDGKDSVNFSLGSPAGNPEGQPKAWAPGSTSPWAWPPLPTWSRPLRRKSPSQWKRDEKRRKEFLLKKAGSEDVKKEANDELISNVIIEEPTDEIELSNIREVQSESKVNDLFKIEGEYKNPKFQPWTKVEPNVEVKTLWEKLTNDNKIKGIEEIGEGSTCFEHCFEFWGTWKIQKEGITEEFLKNSENWPKGVKITKVEPQPA